MASDIRVRAARRSDIVEMVGRPPPFACRAWVAEQDGKIVGMAGYYMPMVGPPLVFSQVTDDLRAHKVWIARAAREFMKSVPSPILAICEDKNAERFLSWLGFEWYDVDPAGRVYLWQTH